MSVEELQCYNKGCGQKYLPTENTDESCQHHPGEPVFHDAYKGWSCCNKKCTDFTEFLNIKGCTRSKHSNIKPVEKEKPRQEVPDVEIIEVKPIQRAMKRPSYSTPMITMRPEIAPSVEQNLQPVTETISNQESSEIAIGTACKNGGCTTMYEGPDSNCGICTYHPGVPIFHEGLKYWSCCRRRTTDFNAFLSQIGCETGEHKWRKENEGDTKTVNCRWDFHQTGTHVFVSVYAKQYCPNSSEIKLNPIRLYIKLVFPQESGASFILDAELNGVIDVEKSHVSMLGTKVEIKMKKAEPFSWPKLEVNKPSERNKTNTVNTDDIVSKVETVDLGDL